MFAGLTPNYVAVCWVGVDDGTELSNYNNRFPGQIWHDVMVDIEDTSQVQKFSPDATVEERKYCTETGLLASANCENTAVGYYRKSNIPDFCTGKHEDEQNKIWAWWTAVDENEGTLPEDYVYDPNAETSIRPGSASTQTTQ